MLIDSMFVVCLINSSKAEGTVCRFVEAPQNLLELLRIEKADEGLDSKS
jgi:hypothetical protein